MADIHAAYTEWSGKGAEFLTEPKDHGREIRACIRDPDGHPIEALVAGGGFCVGVSRAALHASGVSVGDDVDVQLERASS